MGSCSHFKLSFQSNMKYFKFKLKLKNCFYQGWFRKDPEHMFRSSVKAKLRSLFLLNRHADASTASKNFKFFSYWQLRCVGRVGINQMMLRFNGKSLKEKFLQGSPVDRFSSDTNKEIQSSTETRKGHPSEAGQISRATNKFKQLARFWSKHCGDPMEMNSRSLLSEVLALLQLAVPKARPFLACIAIILVISGLSLNTLRFGKESNFQSVWSWERMINAVVPGPLECQTSDVEVNRLVSLKHLISKIVNDNWGKFEAEYMVDIQALLWLVVGLELSREVFDYKTGKLLGSYTDYGIP